MGLTPFGTSTCLFRAVPDEEGNPLPEVIVYFIGHRTSDLGFGRRPVYASVGGTHGESRCYHHGNGCSLGGGWFASSPAWAVSLAEKRNRSAAQAVRRLISWATKSAPATNVV